MTRTVPGSGAVIEPIFNSTFGIKDVFVNDGGTGYVAGDPPELKVGNCGTPLREAILEPVITNGQIAAVKVLDPVSSNAKPVTNPVTGLSSAPAPPPPLISAVVASLKY